MEINLQVKRLDPDAKLPEKNNSSDAGFDLFSKRDTNVFSGSRQTIETGIAVNIPKGYFGLIKPRSGMSFFNGVGVLAGVVDSGYQGEIKVILTAMELVRVQKGDKIAQMVIIPIPEVFLEEVDGFPSSERGNKGFGSSGK